MGVDAGGGTQRWNLSLSRSLGAVFPALVTNCHRGCVFLGDTNDPPILKNFGFDFSNLRGDFFGGLTAGIVALPLALAFGAQTAMGAMAGLYGAIAIGIIAAIFGGTPTQISGPTAPMTVVSSALIASMITESGAATLADALPLIIATFFLAGFIEMLFGIVRLGRYIRYIPYPVVSGFMSGIGVIIILTQLFPTLGYNPQTDEALIESRLPHAEEVLLENILREEEAEGVLSGVMSTRDLEETTRRAQSITPADIRQEATRQAGRQASGTVGTLKYITRPFRIPNGVNWPNFILAVGTIVIIYGFRRITRAVPSTLVALIVMTLVAFFFFRDQVPIIGQVDKGLPPLHLGFFSAFGEVSLLTTIFEYAFTLAALGAIDSLLTSVVADNITKTKHNSNQELIGQGLGNMGAAIFGGLPGAGATMRTVINVQSGGKSKTSGVMAGVFLLAVLLGLGPIVAFIPKGVLAGILITVGIGIIDYKAFRHIRSVPRTDIIVMLVVLFLTVFLDLLVAVGVGMVMAALLFMRNISDVVEHKTQTASSSLREFSREQPWPDEGSFIDQCGDRIYIKHLDGPLFFGFASRFQDMVNALPDIGAVIIRMERVPYVDQSGLYAMEAAVQELQGQQILVIFTGLHGQPLDMFQRINLVPGLVGQDFLFEDFNSCRKYLMKFIDRPASLKYLIAKQKGLPAEVGDQIDEV
ncbi:MAG: SulP family inorganic anion transporter [Lewinella sp.]|nr:SulP family inorganic anion transporter [Lewinella sp.]